MPADLLEFEEPIGILQKEIQALSMLPSTADRQRDIAFDFDLFAVRGPQAFTHWTAHFTWLPVNGIMELDGAARITFTREADSVVRAHTFEEWIEKRDH